MASITHALKTFMAATEEPRLCVVGEVEEMPMVMDSAELGKEESGTAASATDVVIGRPFGCCWMLLVVILLVIAVF